MSKHHYVPQHYLAAWSTPDNPRRTWVYRLLVPSTAELGWRRESIGYSAYVDHLYTRGAVGEESHEVERWFAEDIEGPALDPLNRLRANGRLSDEAWTRLLRYVIALDLRTPSAFAQYAEVVTSATQVALTGVMDALARGLKRPWLRPRPRPHAPAPAEISVRIERTEQAGVAKVTSTVVASRRGWLGQLQRQVDKLLPVAQGHRWSLVEPSSSEGWPTSDHPVVRLAYFSPENFHYNAGWNTKGADIIVPLSPRVLLLAEVGRNDLPVRFTADHYLNWFFKRVIVGRAPRYVYADRPHELVKRMRGQLVDLERYKAERRQRRDWHQSNAAWEARPSPSSDEGTPG